MKTTTLLYIATALLTSLSEVKGATTLTAWTFDNVAIGISSSPAPSTGLGSAIALGMSNNYNHTNSVSNPDIQSLAGSSSGGANSWRVRGFSTDNGSGGNGWSTNAPIGSQGAKFSGSTFGYYQIHVSFDVYATADAEANLQVQYSTDGGANWFNANITSAAAGFITNNSTSSSTVQGTYIQLTNGWNNQVTVDLSGLSGVDNNASFAIRMVNASTGADCVDTTGAIYNNISGSWTLDNVVIQGSTIDLIANWNFDLIGVQGAPYNTPSPTIGSGTAQSLGMINGYTNTDGTVGSSNWCDILLQGGSSTGPNSLCWRVRGGLTGAGATGSGWNSAAPIGSQGVEYDVSTEGYSNIICSFDLYFTTQAPDKIYVLYTTDHWMTTTNVANTLFYGGNPAYNLSNSSDPNLVVGNYFYQTLGQGWYNNCVVDLTGVSAAENNPNFGFRVVNAATGSQYQNFLGQPYNNQSGNVRFANVTVGGTSGTPPPVIAFDPNATVDNPFTNTYTDDPAWRTNISAIYVNGLQLTNTAYTTTNGQVIFNPAKSSLLQASGLLNISIISKGFGTAKVGQPLAAGVSTKLAITTQAAGPSASGGTLTANPVFLVSDKYGNGTTNPYQNVTITAAVGGIGGWTLGGDAQQPSTNGLISFTNLTATVNGSSAVSNAFISFTVVGYGATTFHTNSATFNIGAPPVSFTPGNLAVLQIDTVSNNTTFSIIEINPATARQSKPVNIVPISATGTNALRQSSAATTGRLALSDDGTLVCFAAFADGSAATPDETLNLNRSAAALNSTNLLTILGNFTSVSFNGSEGRAACVLDDDSTWIAVDKGGLYQGFSSSVTLGIPNLNDFNNVVVKTFGGHPWVETQKAVAGRMIPAVYELGLDPSTGLYDVTFANNLGTDQYASDYYLISTNGGTNYDILYIADQVSGTQGLITKYSLVSGIWTTNGVFTNSTGIDGLFATTNGNGGVNLFYTTGGGGSKNNSLVRVTDSAGWNQNISITSSNVLYTATGSTSLKGLTFTPQGTTNVAQLIPPPILTAQNGASVSNPFSITNTPADLAWHGAITNISVNGSTLPGAAYDKTQSGKIVFFPTNSVLLQGSGPRTIVVTATGYGADAVIQTIAGVSRPILGGISLNGGEFNFAFTSTPGLSFSVLATNNLTAPVSIWPVVGNATESPASSGHYQFSDPNLATNSQVYYRLRQP